MQHAVILSLCAGALGQMPPPDWQPRIVAGDLLFSRTPPRPFNAPNIGNGFIGAMVGPGCEGAVGNPGACGLVDGDYDDGGYDGGSGGWQVGDTQRGLGGMFLGGVFNGISNVTVSHRARLPSVLNVQVTLPPPPSSLNGPTTAAASSATIERVGAALDLRGGVFLNRTELHLAACNVSVEQRWYAHQAHRSLLVLELHVDVAMAEDIDVDSESNGGSGGGGAADGCAIGLLHLDDAWESPDFDFGTMSNGSNAVAVRGVTKLPEVPGASNATEVGVAYQPPPPSINLGGGGSSGQRIFRYFLVAHSSLESTTSLAAPWQQAAAELAAFSALPSSDTSLAASHAAAWRTVWDSGIEVDGNLTVGAAINSSLYYIYSSMREDWPYSTSPGGLAIDSYDGRTFWDCETWMFPPVDLLRPALGAALLQYRLDRLPAARARAQEYGFEGAMFPWTSELTGVDDTSSDLGWKEQHVTGDIVHAFRLHWLATGDVRMLARAWPLLASACEFWHGRASLSRWSGTNYTVTDAVGPDESSGAVDGDAYTVAIMSSTLRFCAEAAAALGNASAAPPAWAEVAARPFLPVASNLDGTNGSAVHIQYHGWPRAGKLITQSSVALLQYPLGFTMPHELAVADLSYYENLTRQNGFFTGDSIYSIAWLALGARAAADRQWQAAFEHMDLRGFNLWREELKGGHSNFITGAGGFLQNVINGYGGLRILPGGSLTLRPTLPLWGVTRIVLRRLHFRGRRLTVGFSTTELTIKPEPPQHQEQEITQEVCGWLLDASGTNHTLIEGVELALPTQPVTLVLANFKPSNRLMVGTAQGYSSAPVFV